jgi:hypothetical protein
MLGAIVGAGLYAVVCYLWDRAAEVNGWWTYPAWSVSGQFPWSGYLLAGIVGVSAFSLFGWRIIQRWRWSGFAVFLLFWAEYAIVHDYGDSL